MKSASYNGRAKARLAADPYAERGLMRMSFGEEAEDDSESESEEVGFCLLCHDQFARVGEF